jgi:hypothetical protein
MLSLQHLGTAAVAAGHHTIHTPLTCCTRTAALQLAFQLVMMLYEPSLPEVHTPEDMTPQHQAWAEDFVVGSVKDAGCNVEHIAWLEQ